MKGTNANSINQVIARLRGVLAIVVVIIIVIIGNQYGG